MIVLKRKLNGRIFIGDDVIVEVHEINTERKFVRLCIFAPDDVKVLRDDVGGLNPPATSLEDLQRRSQPREEV